MNLTPLLLTLKVSIISTSLVFILGLLLVEAASRLALRTRNVVRLIATLPLALPPTVLGYYLLVVFARGTVIDKVFKALFGTSLIFTWPAAVVASMIAAFPLFFMTAMPAFEGIDKSLINAAKTLGKTNWQIFRQVKLPLAWRGIASGTLLAFARALGEFGITLMIAGNIPGKTQTAPLAIYDFVVSGNRSAANSLAAILALAGFIFLFLGIWLSQRRRYKFQR